MVFAGGVSLPGLVAQAGGLALVLGKAGEEAAHPFLVVYVLLAAVWIGVAHGAWPKFVP